MDEQIIGMIKERRLEVQQLKSAVNMGLVELFYKYKAKFGGLDVSDSRELKALSEETL